MAKVVLNKKGFTELLHHPRVKADLKRRADAIAAAAGDGFRSGEVREGQKGRRRRAHNVVITDSTKGRIRQARRNILQRALYAGR